MKSDKNFKFMNIIMVICIIVFGELFAYLQDLYVGSKLHNGKLFAPYSMKIKKFSEIYENAWKKGFGKEYGASYKDLPIVIFGGSYAFGYGLKEEDTISAQLAQYLKTPVYNRAFQAWCVQNMLWQLRQGDIYKEIANPKILIYVAVKADLESVYNPDILNGLKYREVNGILQEVPFPFMLLNYSYLYKKINHELSYRKTLDTSKNIKFFNKHIIESKKEADRYWNNYKMLVILYDIPLLEDFSELEKEGIGVISLNDFLMENNLTEKHGLESHPDAKAWGAAIREIVEKGGL